MYYNLNLHYQWPGDRLISLKCTVWWQHGNVFLKDAGVQRELPELSLQIISNFCGTTCDNDTFRVRSASICENVIYIVYKASSYCKVCWEPQTRLPWSLWCERARTRQIWRQPRACHCHFANLIKSNTLRVRKQSTKIKSNLTIR